MAKFKLAYTFFIILIPIFTISCEKEQMNLQSKETDLLKFKSEAYGFSFYYPTGLEEVSRDLPEKWALLDKNKNTIIFLVDKVKVKDLLYLGRSQALRDLYNEHKISELKKSDIENIFNMVKLNAFNNRTWYTYGVRFSDKNVESLVSGTLCEDNEIIFVLVNEPLSFDKNKETYLKILNTFEC